MTRTHLLGAASAVALACASTGALAQSVVNGGGSTLAQFVYGNGAPNNTPTPNEFTLWNNTKPAATFGTYWESGSGAGQLGFLTDNLTCVIQKAQGSSTTCTGTAGGANTQHYGASDATLSSTQISGWTTASLGQAVAGNLIQVPTIGVGVTIPVNDQNFNNGANYSETLTDNDLCGIFSGKITDFGQLTDVTLPAGPITVVYRSDGSGTSFLLTNHFATVCSTGSNGNSAIPFVATANFNSLFSGGVPPHNFVGAQGSSGVASILSGQTVGGINLGAQNTQQSVGYVTPDLTLVASGTSTATLQNGAKSTLPVAKITSGAVTAVAPTTANISLALKSVVVGTDKKPPANAAQGANPALWVPTLATVSAGYPIVGYTTWDLAQCYADNSVGQALIGFLKANYKTKSYVTVQTNNGFVPLTNGGPGAKFLTQIVNHLLGNIGKRPWNDNIQNTKVCKSVGGSTYAGR